jgi:hypothetical protein
MSLLTRRSLRGRAEQLRRLRTVDHGLVLLVSIRWAMPSAMAMAMTVRSALARGMLGMTEASQTNR